jgi:hypothetical protein
MIVSVTFTTEYQCHIYHWMPVSHLQSIASATFTTDCKCQLIIECKCHSCKCDTYNQWQMWLWQSVVNVTLTISGKCDTWNQRFSMAIHRHYYNLHCTSLHTFMPSIKLFLLRKIILLSIRIQLLCDKYHLAILIPSKTKMAAFIDWISSKKWIKILVQISYFLFWSIS